MRLPFNFFSHLPPSLVQSALFTIIASALLALIKAQAGIIGNSYALIADAIESTTDVFSSLLLLLGLSFSHLPADHNHPYGHGRAETLACFMVAAFLIASASVIVVESIQHIRTPHKNPEPFTLLVLLVVVIIKESAFRFLKKISHEHNSIALAAESEHQRSDAITSAAAFIGISLSITLGEGWEAADDWAAILAAGIIYRNAWLIFRPALSDAMDEDCFDELRSYVNECLAKEAEVVSLQACWIRRMGSALLVDLRLAVSPQLTICRSCELNQRIRQQLMSYEPCIQRIFIENCCGHSSTTT
ncbi:MAG: cation diffusion facilitator family transporter [Cardiobacteriaceae bacterium]|nr:cation diffusion facilitator family transporter [Cardiobacteriaceae bacterium]